MKPVILPSLFFLAVLRVHAASFPEPAPFDVEHERQLLLTTQTSQLAFQNHKLAEAEKIADEAIKLLGEKPK